MIKKKNKGFTLVELIVVIVILAILVGVTISGIYIYVDKARVSVDLNNAETVEKALSTINSNKDVIKYLRSDAPSSSYTMAKIYWTGSVTSSEFADAVSKAQGQVMDNKFKTPLSSYVNTIFPDGLPESKSGNYFELILKCNVVSANNKTNLTASNNLTMIDLPLTASVGDVVQTYSISVSCNVISPSEIVGSEYALVIN